MALIRWEPFREMETIQRQMNRLFDQMMTTPGEGEPGLREGFSFVPAAEIHESTDEITLRMELPGIEPQDLDIKVATEAVSIRGERKSEVKQDDKGIHRSEFRYGRFQRVIPLPARIQNDKVQADFKNGVLHLTLPKAEEEKNRVVTVSLSGQNQPQMSQAPQGQEQSQMPQAS